MSNIWNEKEDFVRLTLTREGLSYDEIAEKMNAIFKTEKFTRDGVRGRARRTNTSQEDLMEPVEGFEQKWDKFCQYIGIVNAEIKAIQEHENYNTNSFVVFSDLHVPVHNNDALIWAVETASQMSDVCVVAGDFMDTGSFSPHFIEHPIDIEDEIKSGKLVANYLDSKFKRVYYLRGNHEVWYNKAKSKLPKEFNFLLKDNLLDYVACDLENTVISNNFFMQIGDCIVGHPSKFMKRRFADVIQSYNYFVDWGGRYNINEVNCYVHAHTHKLGSLFLEKNGKKVKLFEGGCLCGVSQNLASGRTIDFAPPMEGFIYIKQSDGKTVLNESREFVYEKCITYSNENIFTGGIIEFI